MSEKTVLSHEMTPAQREAATHTGSSILVSAAAGSGKTKTIADRVAYLVCEKGIPLDRILVVTFTENAALEMKSRIDKRLREAAEICGTSHSRTQVLLAARAQVSTIHAFCSKLLRAHFPRLGIDPKFALLSGEEQRMLARQAMRQTLDEAHLSPNAEEFKALLEWYAHSDDDVLGEVLLKIASLLTSVINPAEWKRRALTMLQEAADNPKGSRLGQVFEDQAREGLSAFESACLEFIAVSESVLPQYADYVRKQMLPLLDDWRGQSVWDWATPEKLPNIPTIRGEAPPAKEKLQKRLGKLKEMIKSVTPGGLPADVDFWRTATASTLEHVRELLRVLDLYETNYARAKARERVLDFADLERLALQLLTDADGETPSDVARSLHESFSHVLVDECQDVNALQDRLISLVSTECLGDDSGGGNLFSVGDIKQSIYRFRLAEPRLFKARWERYEQEGRPEKVVLLDRNFRSRAPLLAAVNRVFDRLMIGGLTEIAYASEGHELAPGLETLPDATFTGAPMEIVLVEANSASSPRSDEDESDDEGTDYEAIEREAAVIATRLKQIIGTAEIAELEPATKSFRKRKVRAGDCAILLRAATIKANQMAAILRRYGLAVQADTRGGLLDAQEITDILSLLRLLDNPLLDLPMVAYLRSPLSGVVAPDAAMARARIAHRDEPFHRAVRLYAENSLDEPASYLLEAMNRLQYWRQLAQRRSIAELLDEVLNRTVYTTYVAGLIDGAQRVANLSQLLTHARSFASTPGSDLAKFLAYLEELAASGAGLPEPDAAVTAENAVRVMTIHKSKGLEFPIVVLPDLAKKFNEMDLRSAMLFGREIPIAPKAVDEPRHALYPSPAWVLARQAERNKLVAEELRTLYVALTRAREHLILVATASEPEDSPAGFTESSILGVRSPIDWILPLLKLEPALFVKKTVTSAEVKALLESVDAAASGMDPRVHQLLPLSTEVPETKHSRAVLEAVGYSYLNADDAERSAVISVTALTHSAHATPSVRREVEVGAVDFEGPAPVERVAVAEAPEFPLPRVLAGQTAEIAATDRGTATHLALEHFDFRNPTDAASVEAFLAALAARGVLTQREKASVDSGAFSFLAASELAPYLRGEKGELYRELPIYLPNPRDTISEGLDRQMVRGRIDLLVDAPEGPVIIDYKTDSVSGQRLQERVAIYAGQVDLYKHAAQAITGRPCGGVYLAFVASQARTIVKL